MCLIFFLLLRDKDELYSLKINKYSLFLLPILVCAIITSETNFAFYSFRHLFLYNVCLQNKLEIRSMERGYRPNPVWLPGAMWNWGALKMQT
jgi:hypothetical protein